jgi:hypothetical protein
MGDIMDINDKYTKTSMFLDGELSVAEMNSVEKMIDHEEDVSTFKINSAKANAYSKSFFRNQTDETEPILPNKMRTNNFNWLLKAASIIFFIGVGTFIGNLFYDRSGPNISLADNVINPIYQNALNMALENYTSGEPYTQKISGLNMQITVIPEKTYRDKDRKYVRKFIIKYDLGDKIIDINGFAERKSRESWKVKTLAL